MSGIGIIALIVIAVLIVRWRMGDKRNNKRAASWLKPWTAARKGLLDFKGIPLGDWGWFFLPVRFHGDGHILTMAAPGGGKSSTGSVVSALDRSIKSRFVVDPDTEVTLNSIAEWRKTCGVENVKIINHEKEYMQAPWNLPSHRFNPMKGLDPSKADFQSKCKKLAAAHITFEGMEDGSTQYFKEEALEKLAAYIAFGAIKGANIKQIHDWVTLSDTEIRGLELRCTASGTKSFAVVYGHRSNRTRKTIGHYPIMTLAEAREAAKDFLHDQKHRPKKQLSPSFAVARTGAEAELIQRIQTVDRKIFSL